MCTKMHIPILKVAIFPDCYPLTTTDKEQKTKRKVGGRHEIGRGQDVWVASHSRANIRNTRTLTA